MATYVADKSGKDEATQKSKKSAFMRAISAAVIAGIISYRDIESGEYEGEWLWLVDDKFSRVKPEDVPTRDDDEF